MPRPRFASLCLAVLVGSAAATPAHADILPPGWKSVGWDIKLDPGEYGPHASVPRQRHRFFIQSIRPYPRPVEPDGSFTGYLKHGFTLIAVPVEQVDRWLAVCSKDALSSHLRPQDPPAIPGVAHARLPGPPHMARLADPTDLYRVRYRIESIEAGAIRVSRSVRRFDADGHAIGWSFAKLGAISIAGVLALAWVVRRRRRADAAAAREDTGRQAA
jgi:hypothetical protein